MPPSTNVTTDKIHVFLMKTCAALWILPVMTSLLAVGSDNSPKTHVDNPIEQAVSLSELAAQADLVALAQVKDTDYTYTRSFPSDGSAFLKILIAYKGDHSGETIIEVYEHGLHPHECYFETPTVFEEGRRYLVFLNSNPGNPGMYVGLEQGCALEVLVTADFRYALRYPIDGIKLAEPLQELAVELDFNDPYALLSEASISPANRDDLLKKGLIVPYEGQFKYTHGIYIGTARGLITAEALTKRNIR